FLMRFDDQQNMLQDFTNDFNLLAQQTERLKPFGGTALYDALIRGMRHTNQHAKKLRQALVVITDGLDQHSRNKIADVLPIAELTGIPCYIIGIYTPDELRVFALNQPKIKLDNGTYCDNPTIALRTIADETAGRVYFPTNEKELVTIAQQITNELRAG